MKTRLPTFLMAFFLLAFAGQAVFAPVQACQYSDLGMQDSAAHGMEHGQGMDCGMDENHCANKEMSSPMEVDECSLGCDCCPGACSTGLLVRFSNSLVTLHAGPDVSYGGHLVTTRTESLYRPPIIR